MLKIVFVFLVFMSFKSITSEAKSSLDSSDTLEFIYPKTMRSLDKDTLFPLILLRKALERSGEKFTLTPEPRLMSQNRVLKEIENNGAINVTWSMTSIEREERLLPIRIPIFKGLFGWRILFTTKEKLPELENLKSLEDLKSVIFIQGTDWPDTSILRSNGLIVTSANEFEALFMMLKRGRGDLFPRSVAEAPHELFYFKDKVSLVVVPNLMIKYTSPSYFFFNKKNTMLAEAVAKGLKNMQQSGEFDQLFYKYNGEHIKSALIHEKNIIELENPNLPILTPVNDKSLWLAFEQVP